MSEDTKTQSDNGAGSHAVQGQDAPPKETGQRAGLGEDLPEQGAGDCGDDGRHKAWLGKAWLGAPVVLLLLIWQLLWPLPPIRQPFALRFTEATSAICAAAVLALLALVLHGLLRATQGKRSDPRKGLLENKLTPAEEIRQWRRRGLKGLVVGADGRASTSKAQATLWTFLTLFAALYLLMLGRTPNCGGAYNGEGGKPLFWSTCGARVPDVQVFDVAFSDPTGALPLLLGLPIAAAVFAKASTAAREREARRQKMAGQSSEPDPRSPDTPSATTVIEPKTPADNSAHVGIAAGVGQLVSNDHGDVDLLDGQYVAFNLLLAAVFLVLLLTRGAEEGLPELPHTLLILSGVTSGSYVMT